MSTRTSRLPHFLIALAPICATLLVGVSAAQQQSEQKEEPTIAVVTGNNVYVRSGAADSFYPFGRLNRGDLVEVTGEKFNWARITTRGPSFGPGTEAGEFFGFIIYPKDESGRFRVNDDGKSGVTLGRMDVLAPNLNTNFNPDDSWKPLTRLDADVTVAILATTSTANNTVHKIALPASAEAWISKAYLRDATDEERAQWKRALSPKRDREKADDPIVPERPVVERPQREEAIPPARLVREQPQPRPAERSDASPTTPAETDDDVHEVVAMDDRSAAHKPEIVPEIVPEKDGRAEKPTLAEQVEKATLEDLEVVLENLRRQPAEIAEVGQLRQMYLDLASRESDRTKRHIAQTRAEQLQIWQEIRERKAELEQIRSRAELAEERTESALLAVYAHADYDAIGRLAASTIYDGKRLPKMLRLQEPGTGRTLAYIEPDVEGFNLIEMIGQWVGMVAEKSYDPALRLNILTPKRIDLLAAQDDR